MFYIYYFSQQLHPDERYRLERCNVSREITSHLLQLYSSSPGCRTLGSHHQPLSYGPFVTRALVRAWKKIKLDTEEIKIFIKNSTILSTLILPISVQSWEAHKIKLWSLLLPQRRKIQTNNTFYNEKQKMTGCTLLTPNMSLLVDFLWIFVQFITWNALKIYVFLILEIEFLQTLCKAEVLDMNLHQAKYLQPSHFLNLSCNDTRTIFFMRQCF